MRSLTLPACLLAASLLEPGSARALPPKAQPPASAAAAYEPNLALTTHEGKKVRFYDDLIRGKVAVINFMFTTCPSICPPMTANLVKVHKLLKDMDVLSDKVVMISITVDPETDTPEVLQAYAKRHGAGRGWYFVTGERETLDALAAKLGNTSKDKMQHSGMLLVGSDAARAWVKVFAMSPPEDIAGKVRQLLTLKPAAAPTPAPTPAPAPTK
jgi:protein SCO1/2